MALGETDHVKRLARAALAAQADLSVKYASDQEWYRERETREKLVQRLIEAGVPERPASAPGRLEQLPKSKPKISHHMNSNNVRTRQRAQLDSINRRRRRAFLSTPME